MQAPPVRSPRRKWLLRGALVLAGIVLACVAGEGLIALVLAHPGLLAASDGKNGDALGIARRYYQQHVQKVVQFLPPCAQYDPEVTYTLRPGARCTVVNSEHTVEYSANRAGLRDDDASLDHPMIVASGDSHMMGWGVSAEESIPGTLERELGVTVLNAAMSSYGTARELALVERLHLGDFPVLVIQYTDNDYPENQYLVEHGKLDILPEAKYERTVENQANNTRYYPFKHLQNLLDPALREKFWSSPHREHPDTNDEEAHLFLRVLARHPALIEGRTVVVLDVNERNKNDDLFVSAVTRALAEPEFAALAPWVTAIDISKLLVRDDYYLLDDHMRPSGHAKVAGAIEAELRRRGVFPAAPAR